MVTSAFPPVSSGVIARLAVGTFKERNAVGLPCRRLAILAWVRLAIGQAGVAPLRGRPKPPSCLVVPTQRFHAAPDCAIANVNVPPRAMGDGALTGCNEIGLAFGAALAPDSDGFAKPTAVERRLEPGRGECWRCAGMALARCHAGHGGVIPGVVATARRQKIRR